MANKNELRTPQSSGVATPSEVPDFLRQYGSVGSENVTRQDMSVPRIVLLQSLSPQVSKADPNYVPGAEPGKILNTVTSEVFDSIRAINCFFVHEYGVFRKRAAGGGFRGTFPTQKEAMAHASVHPDGIDNLEITEMGVHYVILIDDESRPLGEAAIVFTSTKLKVSRTWNTLIDGSGRGVPRFAKVWRLGSKAEKNAKGAYFNFTVSPSGFIPEALAEAANNLYQAVKDGTKTVDRADPDGSGMDVEVEY